VGFKSSLVEMMQNGAWVENFAFTVKENLEVFVKTIN
jgi:hypothetical protein